MELKISNKMSLDKWLNERRQMGHDLESLKGPAPAGSAYSDGALIEQPVNIAWKDIMTGELFAIDYEASR
jgi:hypothetical protein